MKTIEAYFNSSSQTQDFRLVETQPAALGARDIRVEVKAISVNPVDYKVASSVREASSPSIILGWDASGVVTEVGSQVKHYRVGDEVFYAGSVKRPGSNTQYQIVDERIVGKKPSSLSFKEAAAIPLTAITAWESIFEHFKLKSDSRKSVLLLGAAGGVGSIAIQLLKQLTQATVIATASRGESQKWVKDLGADLVVDHRGDIGAQLKEIGHPEVDFVLCLNDTDHYFTQFAQWLKPFGHVTSIVETKKPVELGLFTTKSLTFSWELMFTRSIFETADMDEQRLLLNQVSQLIDQKKIRTTVGLDLGDMSVENFRQAHALLKSGKAIGKIVMSGLK